MLDLQNHMKNYIPKDQLYKRYEEQKLSKNPKNPSNFNKRSYNIQNTDQNNDSKTSDEKKIEIIHEMYFLSYLNLIL